MGTAIVPLQPRHPIVLAQQALSNQAVCEGRFTLGLGVSHHWIIGDMMGLPYERQATTMRCYLDVLDQALRGPGMVDVENELFTIHNPLDITDITPTPVMIAALGPVMLKLAGERAAGTTLWLADERTIASHVVPTITKAAQAAGRPAPRIMAGVPVCLCADDEVDAAVEKTNRTLSEVVASPNYVRLMEHGDAETIGDVLICGSEAAMEKRLRSFAEAGVTDLNARIVPLGEGREEIKASAERTREFLAAVAPALRGDAGLRRAQSALGVTMPLERKSQSCVGGAARRPRLLVAADRLRVGRVEHDGREDHAGHLRGVEARAHRPGVGRVVEDLLEQGHERDEGPRRLGLVRGQELVAELGHHRRRVVLRGPALGRGQAHPVVLDDEAVEPLERGVLLGDLLLEAVGRRSDGLVEEGEEQLVLAGEVLVEAAQRLPRAVDHLLDGELLAGLGAGQQLEAGVEEALHPALAAHAGPSRANGRRPGHAV